LVPRSIFFIQLSGSGSLVLKRVSRCFASLGCSKCSNLHRCASKVVAQFIGSVSDSWTGLQRTRCTSFTHVCGNACLEYADDILTSKSPEDINATNAPCGWHPLPFRAKLETIRVLSIYFTIWRHTVFRTVDAVRR